MPRILRISAGFKARPSAARSGAHRHDPISPFAEHPAIYLRVWMLLCSASSAAVRTCAAGATTAASLYDPASATLVGAAPDHRAHIGRGLRVDRELARDPSPARGGWRGVPRCSPHRSAARIRLARSPWQRRRLLPAPSALEQGVGHPRPPEQCHELANARDAEQRADPHHRRRIDACAAADRE